MYGNCEVLEINIQSRLDKLENNIDCSLVKVWFGDNTIQSMTFLKFLKIVISDMFNEENSNKFDVNNFEIVKLHKDYGLLPSLLPILIKVGKNCICQVKNQPDITV